MKALKSPILWIVLALSAIAIHRFVISSSTNTISQLPLISSPSEETSPEQPAEQSEPVTANQPTVAETVSTCEIGKCDHEATRRAPLDRAASTRIWNGETLIEITVPANGESCWKTGEIYMLDEAGPGEARLFRAMGKLTAFKKTDDNLQLRFLIMNSSPSEGELLSPSCGSFCDGIVSEYPPADAQNAVLLLSETPQPMAMQISTGLFNISGPLRSWAASVPWAQLSSYKEKNLFVMTNVPIHRDGGVIEVMAEAKKNGFKKVTWVYPLSSSSDFASLSQPHFANGVTLLSPAQLSEADTSKWVLLATNAEAKPKDWKGDFFVFSEPLSTNLQLTAQEKEDFSVRFEPAFKVLKKAIGGRNILVMGRGIMDSRPRALTELLVLTGFPNVYGYISSGANWTKSPP